MTDLNESAPLSAPRRSPHPSVARLFNPLLHEARLRRRRALAAGFAGLLGRPSAPAAAALPTVESRRTTCN
jgi:hypothetical protein